MLHALVRLIAITVGAVFLLFCGLFFMRWVGSQQAFQAPPHPWFAKTNWTVLEPLSAAACDPQVPQDWAVYVGVFRKNGEWWVKCDQPQPLSEVLQRSPTKDWLLAVEGVETKDLDKFVDIVSKHDKDKVFAIHARSQIVARYLRKKSPQWIYAADTASLLRLHLFTSLWLETAMDFWPDFVIADEADKEHGARLSEREAHEMQRRQRRVIWREAPGAEKPDIPVQGLLTTRIP